MSVPASLRFLNCKLIGKPDSLERILDELQDMGIRAGLLQVGSFAYESFAFWRKYDEQARHELGIAYEKRQLTFATADDHSYIILTFEISWSLTDAGQPVQTLLQATASQTTMFTQKEYDPERHAQRFLEVGKRLYDLVQPIFGWIERCWPSGYTKWGDIESLAVPHIYWANFFGPEYVRKLGRKYLLNAPGWKKEDLKDGGFLYVLSPSLSGTGPRAVVEQVKQYFGVESVRRKRRSTGVPSDGLS